MTNASGAAKLFLGTALVLAAPLLLPMGTASAAVQVKAPDCGAVDAWAARVNVMDTFNVAPRLALPKAFADGTLVPIFGIPVLAWSAADVEAVSHSLVTCFQEANSNHDATTAGALANANRALLGLVPRTNAALLQAKSDADVAERQIDALPDSAELGNAIEILLHANPATPDMNAYRLIPREIAEPTWRLALAVRDLGDADRDALFKALGERGDKIEAGVSVAAEKAIAAVSDDAAGVIALTELQQKLATVGDPDVRTRLRKSAEDRAQHIRDMLRQAKPVAWVPPSCLELYRWSGAPNATAGVPVAGRGILTAFLDARVKPVFGISISDWSDADIARFKTLRGLCRGASQPQPDAAPEAAALTQVALRGRWVEAADQPISDARSTMTAYHKAQQALAAALAKAAALPDTTASLQPLAQLAVDPAQTAVSQDERTKFANAIAERRAVIGAQVTDVAIKGLDGVRLATLADLPKFFAYVGQVAPTIPEARSRQAFVVAANRSLQAASARLMPELQAKLAELPVDFDGLVRAQLAVAMLTGVSDASGSRWPGFEPLYTAARARFAAIARSLRDQACDDLLSSVDTGSDAKQAVWDGDKGMPLGDFICGLATHGYAINSYSGAGMFSGNYSLKVTPPTESSEIISLHQASVAGGKSMLVGGKIVDSNGQPIDIAGTSRDAKGDAALSVTGWEFFAKAAISVNPLEGQACEANLALPEAKLEAGNKLFRLECQSLLPAMQRRQLGK